MLNNVGGIDRIVRIVIGVVLAYVVYAYPMAPLWQWIAGIVAVIMLVTGAVGMCPIYRILGMSTRKA